jgi:hypothetical protein
MTLKCVVNPGKRATRTAGSAGPYWKYGVVPP